MRNSLLLAEERDGGLFLQPAAAVPVRDIPKEVIQHWILEDEKAMESLKADGKV